MFGNSNRNSTKWSYFDSSFQTWVTTPATASPSSNIVYVGLNDNSLRAFNPDGTQAWLYQASGGFSIVTGSDGTIFLTEGKNLSAVTSAGMLKWTYQAQANGSSPAIGSDGTAYLTIPAA